MKIINQLSQGLVDYQDTDKLQRSLHRQVAEGKIPSTLLVSEFHPVYTAGRATKATHILDNTIPVIETDRAGSITWHGPGQLVVYPIIKLLNPSDSITYIRAVERAVLRYLVETWQLPVKVISGRAGIWWSKNGQPDRKICAIGLKIANGATLHGIALNIKPDFTLAFQGIIPCGLDDAWVCSLADFNIDTSLENVANRLLDFFIEELEPISHPFTIANQQT